MDTGRVVSVSILALVLGLLTAVSGYYRRDERPPTAAHLRHDILRVATVRAFLQRTNEQFRQSKAKRGLADWEFKTNLTDFNRQKLMEVSEESESVKERIKEAVSQIDLSGLPEDLKRQLELYRLIQIPSNMTLYRKEKELSSTMQSAYGSTKVCLNSGDCMSVEPGLADVMTTSRDPEVLKEVWTKWRDAIGPKLRHNFTLLVDALNMDSRENGYSDHSQYVREDQFFQTPELLPMLHRLWEQIRPLYLELHAYTRRKLREKYGSDVIGTDGTIPAHLLGNMWAQQWRINDILSPFPEVNQQDQIEAKMKKKYDVMGLFREAEKFYTSIGLSPMTSKFWRKSMLTKPKGRDVICHGSAYDMYSPKDFRIKMCTSINMEYFNTIHHEMGHVEYYMAYANQPTIFRGGANAGFHEAIGDTIQLSVLSRTHLAKLQLLPLPPANAPSLPHDENGIARRSDGFQVWRREWKRGRYLFSRVHREISEDEKLNLNNLMTIALEKVAFLPFGYLVDKWRWAVYSGDVTQENYNRAWWEMRLKYQGIVSPVPRSEQDFDPVAKYHVASNTAYVSYFFSHILMFQLYQALCDISGHTGPLNHCDIYGSKKAGLSFRQMLSYGESKPWEEQLFELTGSHTLSAQALLEYFRPLHQWLREDNLRHGERLGWEEATINWEEGRGRG